MASGYWSEDLYHSGHIAYYFAKTAPGQWMLDSVERNAVLDDVTEEDVKNGALNDDQIQAMWGTTLKEAQSRVFRRIVAVCESTDDSLPEDQTIQQMMSALEKEGGKMIDESDA